MAPINEYRKAYSIACILTAILYAFFVGVNMPVIVRLADGLIYGGILFTTGIILGNIFRFAIPVSFTPKYRIFLVVIFGVITGLFMSGVEAFAIYLCFPSTFPAFIPTLPARVFIAFLFFIVLYLFYLYTENTGEKKEIPERMIESAGEIREAPERMIGKADENITTPSFADRITVRSGQKIKIIPLESIIYIQADGDYISIRTAEGRWLKEQTMKYTEDRLPVNSFIRIHRSYIVNIHQISRIERYGEKQLIVLNNNEKIKISAARYQTLKQLLGI